MLNPIWHALLAWGLTLIAVLIGPHITEPGSLFVSGFLLVLLGICIFAGAAIIVSVATYKVAEKFLIRILSLYMALILVYATAYFWMIVYLDPILAFDGMATPWHWLGGLEGRRWILVNAALTAVDCFHYSTVTITTLGFGDMHPTHWAAKLLTDSEVLAGLGVVAVGLGRFFTNMNKHI